MPTVLRSNLRLKEEASRIEYALLQAQGNEVQDDAQEALVTAEETEESLKKQQKLLDGLQQTAPSLSSSKKRKKDQAPCKGSTASTKLPEGDSSVKALTDDFDKVSGTTAKKPKGGKYDFEDLDEEMRKVARAHLSEGEASGMHVSSSSLRFLRVECFMEKNPSEFAPGRILSGASWFKFPARPP